MERPCRARCGRNARRKASALHEAPGLRGGAWDPVLPAQGTGRREGTAPTQAKIGRHLADLAGGTSWTRPPSGWCCLGSPPGFASPPPRVTEGGLGSPGPTTPLDPAALTRRSQRGRATRRIYFLLLFVVQHVHQLDDVFVPQPPQKLDFPEDTKQRRQRSRQRERLRTPCSPLRSLGKESACPGGAVQGCRGRRL